MSLDFTKEKYNELTKRLMSLHKEAKNFKDEDKDKYIQRIYEINNILEKICFDYGGHNMAHIYQAVCIDLKENLGPLHPHILKKLSEHGFQFKLKFT